MEILKERIRQEGQNLGRGILKVDSFINHQVDARLMMLIGKEMARRMGRLGATKVLTAEISGIAPAVMTAWALDVPVVFVVNHVLQMVYYQHIYYHYYKQWLIY